MKLVQKVVLKCPTVHVLIVDEEICSIKSFWYHWIQYQNPSLIFYSTVSSIQGQRTFVRLLIEWVPKKLQKADSEGYSAI